MHALSRSIPCSACRCYRSYAASARILARAASTTAQQFPFPAHRNPSPHEVFHLPRNATEADIKARYFDLVRLYHPDKASDVPADVAHHRFQVITHAYDVLRGKKASGTVDGDQANPSVDLRYQTTAAWRTMHRRRTEELYKSGAADDKWKDRLIVAGVIGTILFVITNTMTTRREVMAEFSRSREQSAAQQRHQRRVQIAAQEARLAAEESAPSAESS
ncbi:hypothetical protein CC1G_03275 [Coprinopsis cinerea okayama7|uniref:J domain-containing protein n=1 Tax=Coprinopsis cinerea (strain Okayama-7 / 130 / ATCC MYA-4618 / FGSC 9003) TaxID=240176 RepID=A8N7D2_COPC7|nr:hypothetical protein CC1G_03275 [Coprinopsis cinerea okayama7\|eukprot:XP_001830738.2 hypothetical protein CC1G_03275 [Coprinopsis cinerea okayama7\